MMATMPRRGLVHQSTPLVASQYSRAVACTWRDSSAARREAGDIRRIPRRRLGHRNGRTDPEPRRPCETEDVSTEAKEQTEQLTAAGKVLAVLGTFGRERPGQSLTQISRRTGLPLSTTHRIVSELAAWGALERTSDGNWHIGLRLWELGTSSPRGQLLREVALPYMQDLYAPPCAMKPGSTR